jgi:hypothetical protein
VHLGVPVGCVATSVPGTNIELWSSTEALAKCPYSSADHGKAQPNWSALWEGMVAPLTRMSVKGFLWYQVRYPFPFPDFLTFLIKTTVYQDRLATNAEW